MNNPMSAAPNGGSDSTEAEVEQEIETQLRQIDPQDYDDVDDDNKRYTDLPPKQRQIVLAKSVLWELNGEEPANIDVGVRAYGSREDVNEGYVSRNLGEHGWMCQKVREMNLNKRDQGQIETTGNPFKKESGEEENTIQTWDERPNKEAAQRDRSEPNHRGDVSLDLSIQELKEMKVEKKVPKSVESKIDEVILDNLERLSAA